MGFFDSAVRAVTGAGNRLSGNADFLEAVCAASSLVAAADGTVEEGEIVAAIEGVSNNAELSKIYSPSQIEEEMNKQLKKAKTVSGRMQLKRELQDVAKKNSTIREDVFLIAADVAYADGSVGNQEKKALNDIAAVLGLDSTKLLPA